MSNSLPWRSLLLLALSYAVLLWRCGWQAGAWSLALAGLVWLLSAHIRGAWRSVLAYALFFLTPALTLGGQIGVLTGFGGSSVSLPWLGIAFISAALALHVARDAVNWRTMLALLQPLRFNSGPCALPPSGRGAGVHRLSWRRIRVYGSWLVLGAFFYSVPAAGIAPLLVLKQSTDALDILAFAILFEAYVYFNFSGISFMVYGLLQLAGVPVIRNFNTPFAARDVIGYWQRWHISLSTILKALFFQPLKNRIGLPGAILAVFLCSAMWHGVSFNFVLWGGFHACGWLLTHAIARRFGRAPARTDRAMAPSAATIGSMLNVLLFPLVVILGRLIFSEADSALLLFKLQQLCHLASNDDAWLLHLTLDRKTTLILAGVLLWLLAEVWFPRCHRNYRLLRCHWMPLLLLGLCAAFGNSGLGGVYGAR